MATRTTAARASSDDHGDVRAVYFILFPLVFLFSSFSFIVFFECPFHLDFHFHSLRHHHHNPLLLHPPPLFLPAPVTPHFIAFIRVLRYTLVRWQQIPLGWPLLLAQHTTLAACSASCWLCPPANTQQRLLVAPREGRRRTSTRYSNCDYL
jgi:hypothetical protein